MFYTFHEKNLIKTRISKVYYNIFNCVISVLTKHNFNNLCIFVNEIYNLFSNVWVMEEQGNKKI